MINRLVCYASAPAKVVDVFPGVSRVGLDPERAGEGNVGLPLPASSWPTPWKPGTGGS